MKILVYIDQPSQQKYVEEVRLAATRIQDAEVVVAGPGVASGYFSVAGTNIAPPTSSPRRKWPRLAAVARSTFRRIRGLRRSGAVVARALGTALAVLTAAVVVPNRTLSAIRLVRRVNPDVVVVLEDNCEGLTGFVTDASRRLRRPLLVVPCFIPNPDEPAKYYQHDRSHWISGLIGWCVASVWSHWEHQYDGVALLRLPAETIILYGLVGRRVVRPWILNSGFAAAIAVESETSRRRYIQLGFRASKLHLVGDGLSDELFKHSCFAEKHGVAVRSRYFEDPTKPLIVCAFPPDQYEESPNPAFEYQSYDTLAAGWFDAFRVLGESSNVLVCVHPRMAVGTLQRLESPSVRLAAGHLHEVLPHADIFVASASTTIGWALSLGIPVINYDCYRFGYADFRAASGVVHITDRVAFSAALREILGGGLAVLTRKAVDEASDWGLVDGGYQRRLAGLLVEVAQRRGIATPTHDV